MNRFRKITFILNVMFAVLVPFVVGILPAIPFLIALPLLYFGTFRKFTNGISVAVMVLSIVWILINTAGIVAEINGSLIDIIYWSVVGASYLKE